MTDAAVAELVAHRERFLAFVRSRVRDREEAEEILQGAFVKALARADDVRDDERVVAWFYRLLRNALADHWRARAVRDRAAAALAREAEAQVAPPPEEVRELCRCFEALLPDLPADQARMIRRVDLEEARPVDVAAEEGITPNLAMVRLHRGRRALRARLEQTCRTCATHGCLDCSCRRNRPPEPLEPGPTPRNRVRMEEQGRQRSMEVERGDPESN
jgi:RNA polymerase sigma-70 factor (ECF subfamily)